MASCLGTYLFLQATLEVSRGWLHTEFAHSHNPVQKQISSHLALSWQQQIEHLVHAGQWHLWIRSNQKLLQNIWVLLARATPSKDKKAQTPENPCCGLLLPCMPLWATPLKWGRFLESCSIHLVTGSTRTVRGSFQEESECVTEFWVQMFSNRLSNICVQASQLLAPTQPFSRLIKAQGATWVTFIWLWFAKQFIKGENITPFRAVCSLHWTLVLSSEWKVKRTPRCSFQVSLESS